MEYHIEITSTAKRQIRKLPRSAQPLVRAAIDSLAQDPRPEGVLKMTAESLYRVRVNDYRVI